MLNKKNKCHGFGMFDAFDRFFYKNPKKLRLLTFIYFFSLGMLM